MDAERADGNVAHLAQTRAPWRSWRRCFRAGAPFASLLQPRGLLLLLAAFVHVAGDAVQIAAVSRL